jgi:catechol 2,3-dioxygenase-like lactoylglutathione lyase family enzyme
MQRAAAWVGLADLWSNRLLVGDQDRRFTVLMTLTFSHDHIGITLAAEHLESTIAWYENKLDFTVAEQFSAGESVFTFITNGDVKIELISAGAVTDPRTAAATLPGSHDYERLHHVCLSVTDLEGALADLADREVPVFAGPLQIDRIGQRIAFVRDNVGTIIELTQTV